MLSPEQHGEIGASIERDLHEIHATLHGHEAQGPRQGLRYAFDGEGLAVAPTDEAETWRWRLALVAYGVGASPQYPNGPATVAQGGHAVGQVSDAAVDGVRLAYRRGDVEEWFVNESAGLEHGFTLAAPPPGARAGTPLRLDLSVETELAPRLLNDRDGAEWLDADGAVALRYTGLAAWDTDGRPLSARLGLWDRGVSLEIDADDARYPVTVDPRVQVVEGGALFGFSVALSGDAALVAGFTGCSRAGCVGPLTQRYVLDAGTGRWTQQGQPLPHGAPIALDGDTALVSDNTAVQVYVRANGAWTQQGTLTPSDTTLDDGRVSAVAIDGNTALVGAYCKDGCRGAVYVFVRNGSTWTEQAKLTAADAVPYTRLGDYVALDGDRGLAAANDAAYAFARTGTAWAPDGKLVPTVTNPNDVYGAPVALSGTTALMRGGDGAYVFERGAGGWAQRAKLGETLGGSLGGTNLALQADRALATCADSRAPNGVPSGTICVFVRKNGAWVLERKLAPDDPRRFGSNSYGSAVALDGQRALVGNGGFWGNSAYFYDLLQARTGADLDPDRKADLGVWQPASGLWFALKSGGGQPFVNYAGGSNQIPVPGYYNLDDLADVGVFDPNGAVWYVKLTGGGTINTTLGVAGAGQVPVPADYDGDGVTDLAVWVPETGLYFIQKSSGGYLHNRLGDATSIPVPADYDGDGLADMAVWVPGPGLWFALLSGGGTFVNYAGAPGQIPVPGDYNGDGKADAGVFLPNGAVWYVRLTGGGTINTIVGAAGAYQVPVPADYDGDGRTDLAVWVPETQFWLVLKSTGGYLADRIGDATSVPLQKRPGYPGAYPYDAARDGPRPSPAASPSPSSSPPAMPAPPAASPPAR